MGHDPSTVDRMQHVVETLCSEGYLPRNTGRPGGLAARDFLREELTAVGITPAGEDGFDQVIPAIGGTNLLAAIPGRKNRYVLLGAHYDACMEPNPGADDNAAGVAVTLEVARRLKDERLFRSVIIALFDAEEPPHFLTPNMGSQWFVDHPTVPVADIDTMICLDLVGHALGPEELPATVRDSIFVLGAEKSTGTPELVDGLPGRTGIVPRRLDNYIIDPMSDYDAFRKAYVPFLLYSSGRSEHYHAATDTPEKLDYDKMAALVDHLTDLVIASANRIDSPVYLADGYDDEATVSSLEVIMAELARISLKAKVGRGMVDGLRASLTDKRELDHEERMRVRFLVEQMEQGLA